MVNTPRSELQNLQKELYNNVPQPLHSAFEEKEEVNEAKMKHKERKSMQTPICPATCTGNNQVYMCIIMIKTVCVFILYSYFRC